MAGHTCVAAPDERLRYDFGAGHPMSPLRIDLTWRLAESFGLLGRPGVDVVHPQAATDEELALVHTPAYVAAVKRGGADPGRPEPAFGLGTDDNPTFPGMHESSAYVVGATLECARRVWSGAAVHAVNISGGLHHAMAGSASGFCIYNDLAVAIRWLLGQGAGRVAYIDVDAHHGDGVQAAFYDDPRVLTISLHESPRTLFPGTGETRESGGPAAPGTAVNVPLPPVTDDAGWLRAFHAIVPELVAAFEPDLVVSQHGCDSHRDDPLTHLMLSVDGQRAAHQAVHDLAHSVCNGRWVATGGGGYAIVDVVPRSWTHLLAVVTGEAIPAGADIPASWRAYAAHAGGRQPPATMTDGCDASYVPWAQGYTPEAWLDRCIHEVRHEILPWHGVHVGY
ncbi:MAG TPA: acetoin utilization protein AcuC [Nocardioidaceae bacterium]|nr:acetoin utilization protein AcuC [Nocardioidaceae bacterium]